MHLYVYTNCYSFLRIVTIMRIKLFCCLFLATLISGCATIKPQESNVHPQVLELQNALHLYQKLNLQGWNKIQVKTPLKLGNQDKGISQLRQRTKE